MHYKLLGKSGLRVSEAVGLRVRDINSDRMQVSIVKAKGKKDRVVPLSENVLLLVDEYKLKHNPIEYLFNVKVVKINTCRLPRKKKRVGKYIGWKPKYKKAIVTLSEGDVINLFTEN